MDLDEIRELIENKISPKLYILKGEHYGIHYGESKNTPINKVLITLDLSLIAIHYAIRHKINLIISFYGLLHGPIEIFDKTLVNKLNLLSRYPVSIFILNSSFISAEGGISDLISEMLFLKLDQTFNILNYHNYEIPIGRICYPKFYLNQKTDFTLEMLIRRLRDNDIIEKIIYVGDLNRKINKICIIGGEIFKLEYLDQASNLGCDCFISGKFSFLGASHASDIGISLIQIPFYETTCLALKKLSNMLSLEYPNDEFIFFQHKNPIQLYK